MEEDEMKLYHFNFSRWNDEEKCEEIGLPGDFYLASDVNRLRTEGRERVARLLVNNLGYGGWPEKESPPKWAWRETDNILSALFGEVKP
jgi:hypothetical protein